MFIVRLLRFLRGYVRFTATGGFVERFINLLVKNGIPLWNGEKTDYIYTGCTTVKGYKQSRKFARKTGVRMCVQKRCGLPFITRRYRRRTGIAAGVLLFVLFIGVMSAFVWRIEISGNEIVPDRVILENLEEIGVYPGAMKARLNIKELQRIMLLRVEELSWIAINLQGSTASVEVNERTMPPEPIDDLAPANIIAAKSGQIRYMEVYEGDPMVKVGDAVLKGDLLVSGLTEDKKGNTRLRHSRAKIIAQVEESALVSVPLTAKVAEETGEVRTRSYLRILNHNIPLFREKEIEGLYFKTVTEKTPSLLFMALPVGMIKEVYTLAHEREVALSQEEAKSAALAELAVMERALKERAEIVQRTTVGEISDGCFVINAWYLCEEDIAVQTEILTE